MAEYIFPAVFTRDGAQISLSFPDIPGCTAGAADISEARLMAEEEACRALISMEENGLPIPAPTGLGSLSASGVQAENILCDTDAYTRFLKRCESMDIYGTLGPACEKAELLERMLSAGMTGLRLNLSHGSLREAAPRLENLRLAERASGKKAKLLIDMQGPELRIGALSAPIELAGGSVVSLFEGGIPLPEILRPHLKKGQTLLLDDGKLLLEALDESRARVLRGGLLSGRKSVALPGAAVYPPTLTAADLENIACTKDFGVTGLMQPFVRGKEDLLSVRRALEEAGCPEIKILAKIENMQGVERLEELLPYADEIVIARGDLGNAMPLWRLPAVQKHIAAACRRAGKPFMVVTQMLSSMERAPVPTRAEISDIFNAVLDGASSVMVTGETAVGLYPEEVISYMRRTVDSACKYLAY